jgi:hypothetical protein
MGHWDYSVAWIAIKSRSSQYGAPLDRADLNRRPFTTASRRNTASIEH